MRVTKESKELASVLFRFIKLGKDPSGLLWHIGYCSLLILNEIEKKVGKLKRTWNVGIEGLRDKKGRCIGLPYEAYYDENWKKMEGGRQPASETDELKAGFSKENN